jgi:heat-inducible transcriptional repressor
MRQIDPHIIEQRKKKILQALIHHYIKTGRPVGSSVLTEDYSFDLSPATVRNLMADLETEGYLTHPHTSAGRIPTDKGYRTYVDSLIELQKLVIEEERRAKQEYDARTREMEEVLVQTSRILSALSQYSGFVMAPRQEHNLLQYIELVHLSDGKVLVIMVTNSGMVKHRIVEAAISRSRLIELSNFLNAKLRGLPLTEAKRKIAEEIEEAQRNEMELLALARDLSGNIFNFEEEFYFGGTASVLALPEFQDFGPMRSLLRLNEDKDLLMHIVSDDLNREGVRVVIGSEASAEEFMDLSVVSSVYTDGENPVGVLGIVGPKRMEYPKMMALVSAVSKIVNKILSK